MIYSTQWQPEAEFEAPLGGTEGLKQWVRRRNVCVMTNKCKYQTEVSFRLKGQRCWNHGRQRLCRPEEPTTDWCWKIVEKVQEYGNYSVSREWISQWSTSLWWFDAAVSELSTEFPLLKCQDVVVVAVIAVIIIGNVINRYTETSYCFNVRVFLVSWSR